MPDKSEKQVKKLAVGESATFEVAACNEPGEEHLIKVVPGEEYFIEALQGSRWFDFWVVGCGPLGFFFPFNRSKLYVPDKNYFYLCGSISADPPEYFPIGEKYNLKVQSEGSLSLFPNDLPGWYWNNRGSIDVKVVRKL